MLGAPTAFWSKLRQDADGSVVAWHPLPDHCADVAACTETLLRHTLLGQRLAHLLRQAQLSELQLHRLAALAALHDVGKHNHGFQNKARAGAAPLAGHMHELLLLFSREDWAEQPLTQALRLPELANWGEGDAGAQLFVSAISHHGRPLAVTHPEKHFAPELWRANAERDPNAGVASLLARVERWFPLAFAHPEPSFPEDCAEFQHLFCGLVMLADWLGSHDAFFPFAQSLELDRMPFARERAGEVVAKIGMHTGSARKQLGRPSFAQISPFPPRPMQAAVFELPVDAQGSLLVLESETGSGKTEAALARFLVLFAAGRVDGLYFALPTRTAATQIHNRLVEAVARAFPDPTCRPPVVLAVPGYLRVDDHSGIRLPAFQTLWPDDDHERWRFRGWAGEDSKRYLAGAIAVGTVDQALLSALVVRHAHLRATALARQLLVVDEVHASDAYMTRILAHVLDLQLTAGGHAVLMSATLGAAARCLFFNRPVESLASACEHPYPLLSHSDARRRRPAVAQALVGGADKPIDVQLEPLMETPDALARLALDAAAAGAKVLVLRNTVRACVETQRQLEALTRHPGYAALMRCAGRLAAHHSRFAKIDRETLDEAIEQAFGKSSARRPALAAATQTVQQSLDLDADLLITDLCPMDVLLQRLGRLHRHVRPRPEGFETARVIVLRPAQRELAPLIRRGGQASGPVGLGTVYDDLRILEATLQQLERHPRLSIPTMNRELVERCTHPEALSQLTQSLGGAWLQHESNVIGRNAAERGQASTVLVDHRQPFGDYVFPARLDDSRVQTRLGEGDRKLCFAQPYPIGPFDAPIPQLTLPAFLGGSADEDAVPSAAVPLSDGGFDFDFGERSYRYDRFGLQLLPQAKESPVHA